MFFRRNILSSFRVTLPLKKISRFHSLLLCIACIVTPLFQLAMPVNALCVQQSEAIVMPQPAETSVSSTQPPSMKMFFDNIGKYFGTRYRFGGQTPAGFDCSGFVRFMYSKAFNMHLPRSSREMSVIGNKISKDELLPGDLVFFQTKGQHINHVGIFIGNDTFVHSSLSKGIGEDKLKFSYYEKRFAGAVRLLDLSNDKLPDNPAQQQDPTDITES
jgi:hypothetical protein